MEGCVNKGQGILNSKSSECLLDDSLDTVFNQFDDLYRYNTVCKSSIVELLDRINAIKSDLGLTSEQGDLIERTTDEIIFEFSQATIPQNQIIQRGLFLIFKQMILPPYTPLKEQYSEKLFLILQK